MMKKDLPVIMIGTGGHAKVLLDTLLSSSIEVIGLVVTTPESTGRSIFNIPYWGSADKILRYSPDEIYLVLGFGSVSSTMERKRLFLHFKEKGYSFASVIHPSSVIASEVSLGEGVQIMACAVIQPGCKIGSNTIINTGTSVDHDCEIADHVHLAPGVTLSGQVIVGEGTHVGTGATVIQNIKIGGNCLIAAGSLVIKDVPPDATVLGHPAKVRD